MPSLDFFSDLPQVVDRERLIKAHLPMVDFLVERMVCQVPGYMTRDDMASAAMMGLLDAAGRFDPGRGILFKTFAERRMRGAIIDEARKMDSFSRTLREKQGRIADAVSDLGRRLGRDPEEQEIAQALGLSLEDYQQQLSEVGYLGVVSLHDTLDGSEDGRTLLESIADTSSKNPLENLEARELTRELASHLESLTDKERLVISLYYYEELSQKEIAEVLSLTEGRVSQLHSQALIKLKGKLGGRGKRR